MIMWSADGRAAACMVFDAFNNGDGAPLLTSSVFIMCVCREAMLAEMGIALRDDCSVMAVYTPRKVRQRLITLFIQYNTIRV